MTQVEDLGTATYKSHGELMETRKLLITFGPERRGKTYTARELFSRGVDLVAAMFFRPPVTAPIRNRGPAVGRNDACPCGSGKKFKRCCLP